MSDHVTFSCSNCGSKSFHIPPNAKPDDTITCAGCGAWAQYGDIQKSAIEQGKEAVRDAFRKAFKGFGS